MERLITADRQAVLLAGGDPPDPAEHLDAWERWLASDPNDSAEARIDELERRYLQQEVA